MTGTTPSKPQRLLDLLAFLSSHRFPVGVDRILEGVPGYAREASKSSDAAIRRKFERDKAELRDAGIHIETISTSSSGRDPALRYRLRSHDFYLPVLRLLQDGEGEGAPGEQASSELRVRPEEIRSALEGLAHVARLPAFPFRRAARSALRKLTFDLADEDLADLDSLLDPAPPILHLAPGTDEQVSEHMGRLSDALLRCKEVRFRYYAIQRDEWSPRHAQPRGLLYQGSRWYLAAWDLDRQGLRLFRVDRIEAVEVNSAEPRTADYELPTEHSLEPLREREAWELGEPEREGVPVTVRFEPPVHRLAERNGWGDPLEDSGATPALRRFRVRRPDPFLRWILSLAGDARIEAPESMAERLEAMRVRALAAHRESEA